MTTQELEETLAVARAPVVEATRETLLDNDEVIVVATTYPPGASVPIHEHRFPRVSYVIEGGTIEAMSPDGTVETFEVRPGETLWNAAAHAHSARNIGTTRVRLVEVEVKHAAPKARVHARTAVVLTPAAMDWRDDDYDPRRGAAMLVGDPAISGPYTIRYSAPAGYDIGLHLHPDDDEQLTVLSGTVRWSAGPEHSGAREYVLPAGSFALAPAGTPHRITAIEDCVLQMSGVGPRAYVYIEATDDLGE